MRLRPYPKFPFCPRKRHRSYTHPAYSRHCETIFIRITLCNPNQHRRNCPIFRSCAVPRSVSSLQLFRNEQSAQNGWPRPCGTPVPNLVRSGWPTILPKHRRQASFWQLQERIGLSRPVPVFHKQGLAMLYGLRNSAPSPASPAVPLIFSP